MPYVLLIIGLFFLYVFRAAFHDLALFIYVNPTLLLAIVCIIVGIIFFMARFNRYALSFFVGALLCILFTSVSSVFIQLYTFGDTQYTSIEQPFESQSARIVPLAVAQRFAADSLIKSQEKAGDLDLVLINNSQYWIAPRVPSSSILYYTKSVEGLVLVDAQSAQRKTSLVDQQFAISEDIGIFDNIYWKIYAKKYFIEISEIFSVYDPVNREYKHIAPYISYQFAFPVMKPYFGGVFVIDSKGAVEHFTPEEAIQVPFLNSTRVFPEKLARLQAQSYQFHKGVLNAWFFHDDQIEVTDVDGQFNKQPFLLNTNDGLKWVIATEPYGQSYGVFKIFFIDAVSGKTELYELNESQTLTGPVKVISYVRAQYPQIDWFTNVVVEPRPYFAHNRLFWMVSIVPHDFAGIFKTVLVDAATNQVLEYDGTDSYLQNLKETYVAPNIDENADAFNQSNAPVQKTVTITEREKQAEIDRKIQQIETLLGEIKDLQE